jgi:signal transduction histidine kinase/ligand-binding sensor domain-containing protein
MPRAAAKKRGAFAALVLLTISLSPAVGAVRYVARSWQSEDGLPSNVARHVVQAADGYLWVGTAEGVVRFDGQRFTKLGSAASSPLERQPVRALFPLANGDVWVATTAGSLLRGRGAWLEEVPLPPLPESAPPRVFSHVVLHEGGVLVVCQGTEVWFVDKMNSIRAADRTAALEELLQHAQKADPDRGIPAQGMSPARLRSARGELWEFTPGTGLTVTNQAGVAEPVVIQPEPPTAVRAMMEDREGNLWLATHSQGLWRLKPSRVEVLTTSDGLSDRATLLVMEDRSGALWVAPQSGGLDRLHAGTATHVEVGGSATTRPVSALLETRAGDLWFAGREAQVHTWNAGRLTLPFRADGPTKITALAEDPQGRIWFGGRFGLSVWGGTEPRHVDDVGVPESITTVISAGETIWAGTESGKVFRGEHERFTLIADREAFHRQPISDLLPDADGSLWIGTLGAGLFHIRESKVTSLSARMSEADPRITCVLDDRAGFLWMGTLGGICRVEKAKLLSPGKAAGEPIVILDRSDGLLTRECTRSGQPAGWRGQDGALYFSTGHGVARVRPERLTLNRVPPPVVIEEARIGEQALEAGADSLRGGPGRSRLEVQFTALSFSSPKKVRFRTRLEGLDESWRDTGEQRTAIYEAVPPGRYRFRVVAENGDGVWNEVGASLAVEVRPQFWETRWFRFAVALLASAVAVAIGAMVMRARLRGRLLRMEAQTSREKERARIAQDLHDDLGASLTEIALLANLAAEERPAGGKDDNTFPEVAVKAQALVAALDEIVWAVNPRHDTLRSLTEYVAAFGGKFLERAGMTLRRDLPRDLPDATLDAERRHNVFLAAREALNNAVKHSGATDVWLRVRMDGGELQITIQDNGRGFRAESDELSEGLRGMRERMKRIGGACTIESDATGTTVRLSLPLRHG